MIPNAESIAQILETVLTRPSFVAFARIVGLRATRGRVEDAMRILTSLGASTRIAFEIVDGWATHSKQLQKSPEIDSLFMTIAQIEACRLACYIDDLDLYDWPGVLRSALHAPNKK